MGLFNIQETQCSPLPGLDPMNPSSRFFFVQVATGFCLALFFRLLASLFCKRFTTSLSKQSLGVSTKNGRLVQTSFHSQLGRDVWRKDQQNGFLQERFSLYPSDPAGSSVGKQPACQMASSKSVYPQKNCRAIYPEYSDHESPPQTKNCK